MDRAGSDGREEVRDFTPAGNEPSDYLQAFDFTYLGEAAYAGEHITAAAF